MRFGLLFLVLVLGFSVLSANAEIYRWVDASGNTVYGDNPPKQSAAKPVNLPLLTVADSPAPRQNTPTSTPTTNPKAADADAETYSDFKITAPTADETIRANEGNVTITVSLKPQLKPGDGITLYLDAKQVAAGSSLSFALTEVERGEHSVFAVLSDASGNIIQNTEPVKFNVLRYSALQGQ
ncbi:DUF4124 domain-containing protein [Thiothrix litoralis]|uniref:DUF4124 domain-containing protein n=1 Tax=Thiothrix litoralis TaxID=2891210 RepID=A0ABX7WQQ7_9GAMM|nr:DUF4124 domain-containing protein [Thiothrix litoralis]QTR45875.1 DUF4124 domain-containing protein [Thiothrix litoralis]